MTWPSCPASRDRPFWAFSEEKMSEKVCSRSDMASGSKTTGQAWVVGTSPPKLPLARFTALSARALASMVSSLPSLAEKSFSISVPSDTVGMAMRPATLDS